MDLQDFVSSTLVQIIRGIVSARDELDDTGAVVCPLWYTRPDERTPVGSKHNAIHDVEFDVAVTVEEDKEGDVGGTLKIPFASVGAKARESSASASVSRVRFTVPVQYPRREERPEQ